ncbi:MAG: N-acetylmuramoyl-L-alanine amidase, partial [Pseudonocardiales bacterium]|nr:N-acetylmuramoyl-L-alanine amidase [Pseudonocardiales bacterium]
MPAGNGTATACDTAGTTTVDGYPEHAFTFDVATHVAALLTSCGFRVELTRADDTSIGPCVSGRADLGNSPDIAAAVVSIHADGAPEDGHGFHISQASIPPAGPEAAAASDRLTTLVHDA